MHLVTWHATRPSNRPVAAVRIHRVNCPPHFAMRYGTLLELAHIAREVKPDLVHAHYLSHFGLVAGVYNRLFGPVPTLLSGWGSDIFAVRMQWMRRMIRKSVEWSDAVTVTSPSAAEVLTSRFGVQPVKVRVINWGIDLGVFWRRTEDDGIVMRRRLDLNPEVRIVLSPRTASPRYRIDRILEGFASALPRHENASLVIVRGARGRAGYVQRLVNLARHYGVTEHVRLLHEVQSPEEMASLYSIADATVSVPVSDQFGTCVVEAMACGSVPIVSRLRAYGQYLCDGSNAVFVDGDDSEAIGRAMSKAILDDGLRTHCRSTNRALVEQHENWAVNALRMEALYRELISARGEVT